MAKRKERSVRSMILLNNEQIVKRYFQLITEKDIFGLLDLFTDDAVVYEPFSNEPNGLQGKSKIENFLRVAVMANSGMSRTIRFTDKHQEGITALVTFERGDDITGKFTFHFVTEELGRKINALRIQFAEF